MSTFALSDERAAGQLSTLRLTGTPLRRELYAIRRRASTPRRTATQFWSWLADLVNAPASSDRVVRVGLQQLAPVQPEEQEQRGSDEHHGGDEHADEHDERGVGS